MSSKTRFSRPARPRVFSGIQPSGELHVGNYLGAVRTWGKMVAAQTEELLFCVVDAHAITAGHDPKELRERTRRLTGDLIALGVDPAKSILFVQSDVREHTELAWYLSAVTPMGDLLRMTQFKDKSENKEFVPVALFTYPVLMAADIVLYKATVVPVGDDQVQHLELARETVRRFNHRFGDVFPEPQPRLSTAPRIKGLDGDEKMSKSKGNSLGVFESPNAFLKKLKGAFTDPQRLTLTDPGRPEVCNIFTMHKAVTPEATVAEVYVKCTEAKWGCGDCKKVLFEHFDAELVPLRTRRAELTDGEIDAAMKEGAEKARALARPTMDEVRGVMGMGSGVP